MKSRKAEGEKVMPPDVVRLLETAAHVRAIRAAVDYLHSGLESPDPVIRGKCAAAILKYSNKFRDREIAQRLDALEGVTKGLRPPAVVLS